MDNPAKDVFLPDDNDETILKVPGKRLYHVNIVIRYGMAGREDCYTRYRLVLSRSGIRQIVKFPDIISVNGSI